PPRSPVGRHAAAARHARGAPRVERERSLAAAGGAPLRTPRGGLDDRGPSSRGPARAPRPLSDRGFRDPCMGPADDPRAPGREAAGSPYVTDRSLAILRTMALLVVFAFVAGAGTALSPCVLPVLPIALSAGMGGGRRRPLGVVAGLAPPFPFPPVPPGSLIAGPGPPDGP